MFTRSERNQLEVLSQKLFGEPHHWRRIHKNFRIEVGQEQIKATQYYRLKSGQIVTAETAIDKGMIAHNSPTTEMAVKVLRREATFDELKYALESALESRQISKLTERQQSVASAVLINQANMITQPLLFVPEEDEAAFNSLLDLIDAAHQREALASRKITTIQPNTFYLKGVVFLADFYWVQQNPSMSVKEAIFQRLGDEVEYA